MKNRTLEIKRALIRRRAKESEGGKGSHVNLYEKKKSTATSLK